MRSCTKRSRRAPRSLCARDRALLLLYQFLCRRYKITVAPRRYAHLWFSRWKLPGYPVKIVYYEEHLTIELKAFGTGRVSEFGKAN